MLTYADIKKWGLARLSDVASGVSGVASFNTRTGAVTAVTADLSDSSAAGRALVTAADAAAQRTALGLGTAATTAATAYATAAQGATADTALQPGGVVNTLTSTSTTAPLSAAQGKALKDAADLKLVAGAQLTQAAVTAATAAGVTLLDAADAAAQKTALAITQADVTANAPVSISNATTLTAASHANRQLIYSGTTATLAISNDATGGWSGDMDVMIQTASGSAGVPTISTPDGKSVTGSATQPIGARRKAANEWDVYLLPQSASGGSGTTITHLTSHAASSSHTGVTSESAALKTITLGALASGQTIEFSGATTAPSSNDTTTVRVKLGGTTVATLVTGTFNTLNGFSGKITCTGSSTQFTLAYMTNSNTSAPVSSNPLKTTVNTASSVDLTVTIQNSTTTRSSAIEALDVKVYPA